MCLELQEGFAAPEDEDIDEQAHLDQDEYWTLPSLPFSPPPPFSCPPPPPSIARCWYLFHYLCIDGYPICTICLSTPTTVHALYLKSPVLPASPQIIASAVIYPSHLSMFYITTWRMTTNKASDAEGSTMDFTE